MTFPVVFHIFSRSVPAHAVFELAAYIVGVQTYLQLRRRNPPISQSSETTLWLIVICVVGALIGSKFLAHLEMSPDELAQIRDWRGLLGGKTIVGGLLGGWIAVEIGKKFFGITTRTGDAYVLPLALGIAIGRIGCFFTGLRDHTYGIATNLPWGVDFGDGILRHPTQLYESFFALLLGIAIWLRSYRPWTPGELFRLFMLGYFLFRLCIEFIKPRYAGYFGLSMIQCASIFGAVWAACGLLPTALLSAKEQCA